MKRADGAPKSTMFCPVFRFMISAALDSGRPHGAWTRRHLLRCDACSRFQESCLTLGEVLRSEVAARHEAGRPASAQIFRGPSPVRRHPSMRFVQLAAACIAVTISILWLTGRMQSTPEPVRYAIATPDIAMARAWTQMLEAPLVAEAQSLSNDARSGIRFLITCMTVQPAAYGEASQLREPAPPSGR